MKALLFALIMSTGLMAQAAVWSSQNVWSQAQEDRYSLWVVENFKADIFSNPKNPWYGISTDCADAVYAARIIFAYENSLPVAFTNIENMKRSLTNSMTNWDRLPEKDRVRKFIQLVSDLTSTQTLGHDTAPVAIKREYVRPGAIFLNPTLTPEEENIVGTRGGHAEMIIDVNENGFIRSLYSTTPSKVRELITTRNPYTWPISRLGGFRIWKTSASPAPNNQQFEMAGWTSYGRPTRKQIYQWHEGIRKELRLRPPTIDERIDVVVESICNLWQGRVDAVNAAWKAVRDAGGRCPSAGLLDEHSTNRRDARLREAYGQLNDLMHWRKNNYDVPGAIGDIKDAKEVLIACHVMTGFAANNAWELFLKMIDGHLVADARWSPAVRWGETSRYGGQQCR